MIANLSVTFNVHRWQITIGEIEWGCHETANGKVQTLNRGILAAGKSLNLRKRPDKIVGQDHV